MSYDVYFFRLNPATKVDEINLFIKSDEYQEFLDRAGEDEDDHEEMGLLPARFIDQTLPPDELKNMLGRAWLEAKVIADDESSAEIQKYLNGSGDNPPEEIAEDLDDLLEYAPSGGMQPLMYSYGPHLEETMGLVTIMIDVLKEKHIVMFDPQIGLVVDAAVLERLLSEENSEGHDGCNCNDCDCGDCDDKS